MKQKIIEECNKISIEECKRAIDNLILRLNLCIQKNGKHFANVLKIKK